MLEWSRTNSALLTRVFNLKAGGGLNRGARIDYITISDDGTRDELQGDSDTDWFWSIRDDRCIDLSVDVLEPIN